MEVLFAIVVIAVVLMTIVTIGKAVKIIPQQRNDVVERFGKYRRILGPGLNLIFPFIDRIRSKVDLREQVVSFPPQGVITSDNLRIDIDTVLYFRVVDPRDATYNIASFIDAIEQLTVTSLRNVIGSMDLETALTSREMINAQLSKKLDETTGKWGVKVTAIEIKAIEPPPSIRDAMEKQMRAERDRRAAILNAEGVKASQILTAEGDKQAAVLRADGDRQARILQAEGQAKAVRTVFGAIHNANPDSKVLAYQYLQALPEIANGSANKVWVVPAEMTRALEGIGGALGQLGKLTGEGPLTAEDETEFTEEALAAAAEAAKAAEAARQDAELGTSETAGRQRQLPESSGVSPSSVLDDSEHTAQH